MSQFELTLKFPGGGPLVGGAGASPQGFHASHAQLPGGRPYIPATAIRGALRESFEAVLRGAGQKACAGGDGIDPELRDAVLEPGPRLPCALGSDGTPCLACRLFGTQRPKLNSEERGFSALVLGDASPVGEPGWTTRPTVAVDRASRSAADKHLRFQRIPESSREAPLAFIARGRVNDRDLVHYFKVATEATTHIGAGRSRGLARVELKLNWHDPPALASQVSAALAAAENLLVRVTLKTPALVGTPIIGSNYLETRHEIPGSTVRGAIGFTLRELLPDADGDQATQDLLDADRGAQFGFLYPADGTPPQGSMALSGPMPITAAVCKRERRTHGVADTLLDRLVLLHATSAAEAERATQRAAIRCQHPQCAAPLRTAHGSRRAAAQPRTRTIVRVSMDRTRQSARDGQLFSQVLLAPGVILEGTIRNIPSQSRERLLQALGSGIISFGRGRSAGWGQAHIAIERAPAIRPLQERAEAFDRALRARLAGAGLASERVGHLVPVTLMSPLWPSGDDGGDRPNDGERDLLAAVGATSCFLAARRFVREGAWDQRTGTMNTFQATAAGGVFVLDLGQTTWRATLKRLESLERHGIGQRRDQGYGQILCFDPHFPLSQQNG